MSALPSQPTWHLPSPPPLPPPGPVPSSSLARSPLLPVLPAAPSRSLPLETASGPVLPLPTASRAPGVLGRNPICPGRPTGPCMTCPCPPPPSPSVPHAHSAPATGACLPFLQHTMPAPVLPQGLGTGCALCLCPLPGASAPTSVSFASLALSSFF